MPTGGSSRLYVIPGNSCEPTDVKYAGATAPYTFVKPVTVGDRRIGAVRLTANTDSLREQMTTLAVLAAFALATSALLAYVLSRGMQRAVTGPVMALAETANLVAQTRQFGLRAEKTTQDEVGSLVTAFNGMLDRIERQDRMKDEFLATLSHELRTPLNATLGWLQILQKTSPDSNKMERALASIERNARAQQRVVEDLLDISRIVTGRLQVTKEVVDLRAVLEGALDVIADAAARKGLAITTSAPAAPCLVTGDAGRLQQVLLNLLANSVKFTPAGGSITASLAQRERAYLFTVQDTGIGITADFLPHVFDRFQQADGSATREHGGLGLGLAIVKEIAELHGGTVVAASSGAGLGATFTLSLPRLLATDDSSDQLL